MPELTLISSHINPETPSAAYIVPVNESSNSTPQAASAPEMGPITDNQERIQTLAQKCVASSIMKAQPIKAQRKRQTCRKCGIPECAGSQRVSNCKNKCSDCGNVSCKGKNPKYLDKSCAEGWD